MKLLALFLLSLWVNFAMANNQADDWFRQFKSLHSTFTQYVIQDNQPAQISKGELWFVTPFYFRANYVEPSKLELVSDGKTFYNYDVELMQVTTKPAQDLANQGLINVLSGTQELSERYMVKVVDYAELSEAVKPFVKETSKRFSLIPKHTDDKAVKFVFVFNNKQLNVISAEDEFGASIFVFHDAEINVQVHKDRFIFTVPDGVDVLGNISASNRDNQIETETRFAREKD